MGVQRMNVKRDSEEERCWVRVYYQGQRPRTGKLFPILSDFTREENQTVAHVEGKNILHLVKENIREIDLFRPMWYDDDLEGFLALEESTKIKVTARPYRINVVLEPNSPPPISPVDTIMLRAIQASHCPNVELDQQEKENEEIQRRSRSDPDWRDSSKEFSGWFGIGIFRGKTSANHGTLWRSAYQLGASFVFSVGARYAPKVEDVTDVYNSWQKIPFIQYPDWDRFVE